MKPTIDRDEKDSGFTFLAECIAVGNPFKKRLDAVEHRFKKQIDVC